MAYADPKEVEQRLTTPEAKAAFNALNDLGCKWVMRERNRDGKVYLNPCVGVKSDYGQGVLYEVQNGSAHSYDDAVTDNFNLLVHWASRARTIVIANPQSDHKSNYLYLSDDKKFIPFK
ncbi:MAG: hypothetical protein H6867_03535 [Rhodospirillales bacterium]|nr:hypothetical protein [Rhodospirillales bacterium]MCB9996224.1 hypothetical protein [Rhodospirillales bacterium]